MKLVSAAKLRKTQEAAAKSRVYTNALKGVLSQLQTGSEFSHPLLEAKAEVKRVRVLVLGGARGLCGAFNTNINRAVDAFYREHPNWEISATILGKKPAEHFRRTGKAYVNSVETLPEDPLLWPTDEACKKLEAEFLEGKFDELHLVYTRFKSAISMKATVERIFPLDKEALEGGKVEATEGPTGNTLIEPGAKEVFDVVVPRIVRAIIRQSALDTKASEHASRMTAMDNATKNASELIHTLTQKRNKLRQAGITNQLLDIVGGAEALS